MSRLSARTTRRLLLLVYVCFLLRGLFYSAMFPIWEGFDEYAHFAFVQYVASHGGLPRADTEVSREIGESLKLVPLPWMLRDWGPPYTTHDEYWRLPASERDLREARLYSLPRAWAGLPAEKALPIYEAQQPPLYYWLLSLPLRAALRFSLPGRLTLLRLLSVLLASLAIPLGYLLAVSVLGNREYALGITALISIMPGLMIDICRVGNDSLSVFLYTLLAYAALTFFASPGRRGTALLLALALGVGLLTKAYFLTAIPALGALLIFGFLLGRGADRAAALTGTAATGAALILSGWWYWRNHTLTGSWSGLMQDVTLRNVTLVELLRKVPQVDWRNALDSTFLSHIWFGAWSFLQVRYWIYHAYRFAALLALLGLLVFAVRALLGRGVPGVLLSSPKQLLILGSIYGFFWLGLFYHVLITFATSGQSSSAGWYLYCMVVVEVVLMTAGLLFLSPERLRRWVVPAATTSFGLLDIYTVHFLFIPYYTGLIAHKANGALEVFVPGQVSHAGFWNVLDRLRESKACFPAPLMLAVWVLYLAATFFLAGLSVRLVRRRLK